MERMEASSMQEGLGREGGGGRGEGEGGGGTIVSPCRKYDWRCLDQFPKEILRHIFLSSVPSYTDKNTGDFPGAKYHNIRGEVS